MSAPRPVSDWIRNTQTQASNPDISTFVSANAGSGKTHVLVQRVIRLLLQGVEPQKVLCITFTKAAAANMAQRVFETLGRWVALDDHELQAALRNEGISFPDADVRTAARKLFARALDTPGGLKVQTIHALCTRLLQQFPFEANVPVHFAVLDDRDQTEMIQRASMSVLLDAAARPDSSAGRALTAAMNGAADVTFRDVIQEACLSRDHFMAWIDRAGGAQNAAAQLSDALNVRSEDRIEDIDHSLVEGPHLPGSEWLSVAAIFNTGTTRDRDQAARLRKASASSGASRRLAYLSVFMTADDEPRKSIATSQLAKAHPGFAAILNREADRLAKLLGRRCAILMRDRTQALVTIASSVAANYRREKQERGLLDYDDLIDKTLTMLNDNGAGWVHYKLDRGVDHVLIDEAQDTSPKQWEIISQLVTDFTSGAGARDGKRTIFAVGDEKQSIFSFQGAAPRQFDEQRLHYQRKFAAANLRFDPISFTYSFRSGVSVLRSVESVFAASGIYQSVTSDAGGMPPHMELDDAAPSVVDLWDLYEADKRPDIEGWRAPFDGMSETTPEVKLAQRMAGEIRALIAGTQPTGRLGERRALKAGDILVLVRRRGKLFDAVIQALKHAGVPVAGADRLKLTDHIAVIDLMNLADAILLPADDLALAVALKSPIFGFNEDQLFRLAHGRKGPLRDSLAMHAQADEAFRHAFDLLVQCEERAASISPFAFYAWLLGNKGVRRRVFQRLGHEPGDALDEFLELALKYEKRAPSSLQGFLAWLRAADTEIKRDMEISRDEVRVMTVHGAKGLEAPVVFLMDTTSQSANPRHISLIRRGRDAEGCVVWGGRKADDPPSVATARQQMLDEARDEYRRLLYVAMTRAAERLIVGGTQPGNRRDVSDTWYDLVANGLGNSPLNETIIQTPEGRVRRYSRAQDILSPLSEISTPVSASLSERTPDWLWQDHAAGALSFELRRPSIGDVDDATRYERGESAGQRQRALRRGVLVHRLLQSLPDIAPGQRGDTAARYLARQAAGWSDAECEELASQTLALIEQPQFAGLFAAGGRAEVPIVGRIDRAGRQPLTVSGQIDRLVVTDQQILIADYKTNHTPPRQLSDVPLAYRQQLALYRSVLAKIYPGKPVRAALIWTETPEMMEIPPAMLDQAMLKIISS